MRAIGNAFEQRACAELERAGLKLLARNYNTRFGELDLVMLDGNTIVFVEVRYRKHSAHGDAAASVTASKRTKLIKAAEFWLAENPKRANSICRFDIFTYDGLPENARGTWLCDAFDAN
ncbi:YraN family protein [Rhodanobacter sp. A1T4]|uniref:YraN family protein n=1 Tax=Rhodanobacter sp. A1T4 TaxID=2723087 RepID=UPI001619022D|nr:YraN family protein [Rhodanobacter sp. A1T4]MBB6246996.1 putative endonuclease [Rhodanobacter sp. A1T4]